MHRIAALICLVASSLSIAAFAQGEAETNPSPGASRAVLSNGYHCPAGQAAMTPEEIIQLRVSAVLEGNVDLVMCTYAPDAVVIMPGAVFVGREQIRPSFEAMGALFGGSLPTNTSLTVHDDTVLLTWVFFSPFLSVPDGADTFVIRNGYIHSQTVHATLQFAAPPAP